MDSITSVVEMSLENTGNYRHAMRRTSRYQIGNDIVLQHMSYQWKNDTDKVTSISVSTDTTISGTVRVYRFGQVNLPSNYPYAGAGVQSIKVEYKDADEVYIGKGVVHIDDGSDGLYSVDTRFAKQLTGLSANDWYYIFAKPPVTGNVLTTSEIEYTTVSGNLSYDKVGYYHPTNTSWRCISAIWSNGSNNIEPFTTYNHEWRTTSGEYIAQDLTAGTANTYTNINMTIPFGNVLAIGLVQGIYNNTAETYARWRLPGATAATVRFFLTSISNNASSRDIKYLPVDSQMRGEYKWDQVTNNSIYIDTIGFTFPYEIYTGPVYTTMSGNVDTFLDLSDTPSTYGTTSSGSAGNYLMATSSGIEYREFYYYGAGNPPTASGLADGVLYFKYTA
jgi:hypothetical protein